MTSAKSPAFSFHSLAYVVATFQVLFSYFPSVCFHRFGFFDPLVEHGCEVWGQFVEGEAHAVLRLDARDGAVGFEHFVFGVDFDDDRRSLRERISDLDVTTARAEVADLG